MVGKNMNKLSKSFFEKGNPQDYTKKSSFWEREEPKIQSDFLCRPYIFNLIEKLKPKNKTITDIGCGEGYVCRYLASRGAKVIGIDNSEGLINSAKKIEEKDKSGIKYFIGSALKLEMVKSNQVDIAVSVLVFGHFMLEEVEQAIKETSRILKANGKFILAVPHPLMYICKPKSKWIKFNYNTLNYFEDSIANITLYNKDKQGFDISARRHKFEDYLNLLINNGFIIQQIIEPKPIKNDLDTFSEMWGEETSIPTYLIIEAQKQ